MPKRRRFRMSSSRMRATNKKQKQRLRDDTIDLPDGLDILPSTTNPDHMSADENAPDVTEPRDDSDVASSSAVPIGQLADFGSVYASHLTHENESSTEDDEIAPGGNVVDFTLNSAMPIPRFADFGLDDASDLTQQNDTATADASLETQMAAQNSTGDVGPGSSGLHSSAVETSSDDGEQNALQPDHTASQNSRHPVGTNCTQMNELQSSAEETDADGGEDARMISAYMDRAARQPTVASSDVGSMSITCRHCRALHFEGEIKRGGNRLGSFASFNSCCGHGKVKIQQSHEPAPLVSSLFNNHHAASQEFFAHIRHYNSALAFASMVADGVSFHGRGPYTFKVHGQIYHYSGCLQATAEEASKFAQLYVMDSDMATELRLKNSGSVLHRDLLQNLSEEISRINVLARSYRMMKSIIEEEDRRFPSQQRDVTMVFDIDRNPDRRRYNIPVENEIAAVFVSDDGDVPANRAIVVRRHDNRLQRLPIFSPFVDPMTYPLLFPGGNLGWHPGLKLADGRTRLTMHSYYSFLMHYRDESHLHMARKLFQQFLVDVFCRVEENNLNYIRFNQKKFRVESYMGLMDHLEREGELAEARVGKKIILPSSFNGGPRNKTQHFQDAMSMVAKFGKPDFFVTFTCNPRWPEIVRELKDGQQPSDRPDIVSRVFKLKLDELLHDLLQNDVLGKVSSHIGVIEFQKRGLPHAHILLTLNPAHKLQTPDDVDKVVCAELPGVESDPEGHAKVLKHMIHGPCGDANTTSPCMVDGTCIRKYPKNFSEETQMGEDGFSSCRRRRGSSGRVGRHTVDSRWVVPYNRYLLLKYDAHINVEVCASIKSVKYLHKYLFKGHDAASLIIRNESTGENIIEYDEVKAYIEARYVGAPEAAWRLSSFPMQFKSHTVIRLAVHCEDLQQIVFEEGQEEEAADNASSKFTTLTAFFELNRLANADGIPVDEDDKKDSRNFLYVDMPRFFTFNAATGWSPRKRFGKEFGRVRFVSPADSERYHLRLLLMHVKGADSFNALKTVDGVCYPTFKAAAMARGLIFGDDEYKKTLDEAALKYPSGQLRQLFADILVFCKPSNQKDMWDNYKKYFMDDFEYAGDDYATAERKAYIDIKRRVDGRVHLDQLTDEQPNMETFSEDTSVEARRVTYYQNKGQEMYETLNDCQKAAADRILTAAEDPDPANNCFFLDGPGGSGKTYVYEVLNYLLKGKGKTVINVAWSGIAAQLLPEGKTVHSVFKLPVPITKEHFMPSISAGSVLANHLLGSDVIIWDEAPMSLKHAVHGVDELLRDLTKSNKPFGAKIVIFGGDFRQIPPIVKENTNSAVVEASLKRSYLWRQFNKFQLNRNMRATNSSAEFQDFLMRIGNGTEPTNKDGEIVIPENLRSSGNLIEEVFGDDIASLSPEQLSRRAILCPKNCQCAEINDQVLDSLPGAMNIYHSIDEALCEPGENYYSPEFLNALTPPGLPEHELKLKPGAMVMLLRNLSLRDGLCNGTRLMVVALNNHTIECKKLDSGQTVLIPRIDSIPCETDLPFKLKRHQFPLKLCFSLTVHKSQGQSFDHVGVYLPTPVFSHGQLYVALSRTTNESNLKVFTPTGTTKNVVIAELLM